MRTTSLEREFKREETIKIDTIHHKATSATQEMSFKLEPALSKRTVPLISKGIQKKSLPAVIKQKPKITDSLISARVDSIFKMKPTLEVFQMANNKVRQVKSEVINHNTSVENFQNEVRVFKIQWHQILSNSFACIAMFLIGAPLGAIMKRGGLGVPFLVSIFFFIVFYLLSMQGQKWAKNGSMSVITGVWEADVILLIIGLFFLRQARVDARLFDSDFYMVVADKVKGWLSKKGVIRGKG